MGEEQRVKILRSYSKVWKIERVFYQLGGINLPLAVALNSLLYYLMFLVITVALSRFKVISLIPPLYRFILLPGALAWLFNNKLLDGKNPVAFLRSIFTHYLVIWFKGSRIVRFRNIKVKNERAIFKNKISFRVLIKV